MFSITLELALTTGRTQRALLAASVEAAGPAIRDRPRAARDNSSREKAGGLSHLHGYND